VKVSSKPKSTHIGLSKIAILASLVIQKCSTLAQQNDYKFAELLQYSIGIVAQQILSNISYEEY
jgi:hypothetical protein